MSVEKIFHKAPAKPGLVPAQFVVVNVDGLDKIVPLTKALNFLQEKLSLSTAEVRQITEELQKKVDSLSPVNLDEICRMKGEVLSVEYLPKTPEKGDSYRILHSFSLDDGNYPSGTTVYWTGEKWGTFGGQVEIDETTQQQIIDKLTPMLKSLVEEAINENLNWYIP